MGRDVQGLDTRLEALGRLALLEDEEILPFAHDDVEPAVDREGREDRFAESRARERRRHEGRDRERAADAA